MTRTLRAINLENTHSQFHEFNQFIL